VKSGFPPKRPNNDATSKRNKPQKCVAVFPIWGCLHWFSSAIRSWVMANKTLKVAIVAYEGLWVSSIIIFVDVHLALRLLILQAEITRRMTQPFPFKNVFEKELFFPSLKKFSSKVVIFELKTCMLKSSFKVFWNYFLKWNWIFAWANWPPFRRGSNCNRLVQVYSLRFYISQVINQFGWFIASSHLIDNFVKLQVVLYKVNQQKRVMFAFNTILSGKVPLLFISKLKQRSL